jgi:aspartate/methionine/tyrosine aminotransferase
MRDASQPAEPRPPSVRAATMPRSAIREVMALAAELSDVIHLEVGEPDIPTSPDVIDAAFRAARSGATRYTANAGMPSLRDAIARRTSAKWAQTVSPADVVVTTGAVAALSSALNCILDSGDEVLIPDPGWPNYDAIVHMAGATSVRYALRAEDGFLPDPDAIGRLIGPRTKAILLNTPGNPTGAVFPADGMAAIGAIANRTGIYVVSDEIYEDIVFEGGHVSAAASTARDRLFVISGVSKTYAMTGWRLGWAICPPLLAARTASLSEPVASCAASVSQKAAEAALLGDQGFAHALCDTFRRRRDAVVRILGADGLLATVPHGAFYALVDISACRMPSLDFAKSFLTRHHVAVVPGGTFGPACEGFVRIAFTVADAELEIGLERLRSFILETGGRA